MPLHIGLIVNPYAGVGGPAARKGSDAAEIQTAAATGGLALTAPARIAVFLKGLLPWLDRITVTTVAGFMGSDHCRALNIPHELVPYEPANPSSFKDTEEAARQMLAHKVDLLVFAGGDGTARDVCRAVGLQVLALGVPAGVKMHSGVYAVNPQAAAEVVRQLAVGELVSVAQQQVRDIDEAALAEGVVKSRYFGLLRVPDEARFVQQVKQGGRESEALVLADIAAELEEDLDESTLYILGPGSTMEQVATHLGWSKTLLGVDAYLDGERLLEDADRAALTDLLARHSGEIALFVTAIGGQGHVLGRGNQQLSPQVLSKVGRDRLRVVASRTKLQGLKGRPLLLDSGDPALDEAWSGWVEVITGYRDRVLYPVAASGVPAQPDLIREKTMPHEKTGRTTASREDAANLMSELHELFGNHEPTPQQQQLMRDLEAHIHGVGEPAVDQPNLVESLEVAVEDLETEHPRAATTLREILNILRNIGV